MNDKKFPETGLVRLAQILAPAGPSDALIGNGVFTGVMNAPDGTVVTEDLGGFVTASGGN